MLRVLLFMLASSTAIAQTTGDEVYKAKCASCHDAGVERAPRVGSREDWVPRVAKGRPALIRSAIYGMPKGAKLPRTGDANLSDRDLTRAVDYMLSTLGDLPISNYSRPARIDE